MSDSTDGTPRDLSGRDFDYLSFADWVFFVGAVLVHHGTYCANSFGHLFGGRRFDTRDGGRNSRLHSQTRFDVPERKSDSP